MTTFVIGNQSLMARAASMPPVPGMATSNKTTSGTKAVACAIASAPSAASPTTTMSASAPTMAPTTPRNRPSSSATRISITWPARRDMA
jgi:hypothetical protein